MPYHPGSHYKEEAGAIMRTFIILAAVALAMACNSMTPESTQQAGTPAWGKEAAASATETLVEMYGEGQRARAERGTRQTLDFWRESDGDAEG